MKAGRMDIACQVVIMSFFLSHKLRDNVKLHLVFDGGPDPPKHLELCPEENQAEGVEKKIDISKKDVASLIKKMLYKYRKGQKTEVAPGYYIEKKGFIKVIEELTEQGKKIYLLDKCGEDIRKVKELNNGVFVLGDQDGIPKKELRRLKKVGIEKISVGDKTYFASQTITIIQNELDRRGS